MTIEEKRDYLDDYCSSIYGCKECIFNKGIEGCKYAFLNDEDCIKAYDELKKYETKDETSYWEIDGYGILTADESMTKLIEFIIEKKLNYSDFHKAFLVNL